MMLISLWGSPEKKLYFESSVTFPLLILAASLAKNGVDNWYDFGIYICYYQSDNYPI